MALPECLCLPASESTRSWLHRRAPAGVAASAPLSEAPSLRACLGSRFLLGVARGGENPAVGRWGHEALMLTSCGAHAAPGVNREPQHLPLLPLPRRSLASALSRRWRGVLGASHRGAAFSSLCRPQFTRHLVASFPGISLFLEKVSQQGEPRTCPEPQGTAEAGPRAQGAHTELAPLQALVRVFAQPWCSVALALVRPRGSWRSWHGASHWGASLTPHPPGPYYLG